MKDARAVAKRVGRRPGRCHLRGVGGRSHDRKPARDKRTTERHVSRIDQQPLFERRRMRDDDVQVAGGSGMQNRSRRRDNSERGNRRMQRIEQRQRPRLLDGRRRAKAQRRCLRAAGASRLYKTGESECESVSRHVTIPSSGIPERRNRSSPGTKRQTENMRANSFRRWWAIAL
jgi:hypothetical protein